MKSFTITKKETYIPLWVSKDFFVYNESFINIRKDSNYKCNSCFKCSHKFDINEKISLVCLKGIGNKVFCAACAEEIEK
jgi:hypothetical protein